MKKRLRQNGLGLTLHLLFLITWLFGQAVVGHHESNNERRQRGSPESKPVDAPHGETGE